MNKIVVDYNFLDKKIMMKIYEDNLEVGLANVNLLDNPYFEKFSDILTQEEFKNHFPKNKVAEIASISVKDNYKSSGLGTKLLNIALTAAEKFGYADFFVEASPIGYKGLNLPNLVKFYEKFGFKRVGERGNNVLMVKNK